MEAIEAVLSFWFEPQPRSKEEVAERNRFWFGSKPEFDEEIRKRFGALVEQACRGELDAWAASPRGALALLILIDQFCRNLHRNSPEAFAHDPKALALAKKGFESGLFDSLTPLERMFAMMPFEHAEDLEDQKQGVVLAVENALGAEPHLKDALISTVDYARRHLDVIARFGRFPHRNAVLGRASTPEEARYVEYLKFAGQWL